MRHRRKMSEQAVYRMDIIDVLTRISRNDTGAFRELMQTYGKGVYLALFERSGDRQLAVAATKRAFITLYAELNARPGVDPAENLLTLRALTEQERALEAERSAIADDVLCAHDAKRETKPCARFAANEERATAIDFSGADEEEPCENTIRQKRSGAGRIIAAAALSLGIVAALWVIAGLLMSMELIPQAPLGYAWFNANVAQWF